MKNLFPVYLIAIFFILLPASANSQCSSFYTHTYNTFIVYPYSFNADITNNGGSTNLRIRTFRNGNGNKVIMDNPDALSTIRYGGVNESFYSLNTCGLTISNTPGWTDYGLLAENSTPNVQIGTSYIPVTLSVNGVYRYGWLKIGITPTADTVFVYSLMINQTSTSSYFTIGQCDVTWPTVCATTDIEETANQLNDIRIYPNPASSRIFIDANGLLVTEVNIYDASGRLISAVKEFSIENIEISDLSAGIYFTEIKTNEGTKRLRWSKHN